MTPASLGDAVVCEVDEYDLSTFAAAAAGFGCARYGYVVTPNVDHLLRLLDDVDFRAVYRDAAYTLLDSRVVAHTLRLTGGARLAVTTGADLTAHLLQSVVRSSDRLVLIGGSAAQADRLAARYGLTALRHYEPPMGFIADAEATEACLRFIEAAAPFRFCFLAVGSPQQEFIAQALHRRRHAAGLVLCVGAAINFLTGAERRAPPWMRHLALEWLYRLIRDPARLAHRYLVRGPRVFGALARGRLVIRARAQPVT